MGISSKGSESRALVPVGGIKQRRGELVRRALDTDESTFGEETLDILQKSLPVGLQIAEPLAPIRYAANDRRTILINNAVGTIGVTVLRGRGNRKLRRRFPSQDFSRTAGHIVAAYVASPHIVDLGDEAMMWASGKDGTVDLFPPNLWPVQKELEMLHAQEAGLPDEAPAWVKKALADELAARITTGKPTIEDRRRQRSRSRIAYVPRYTDGEIQTRIPFLDANVIPSQHIAGGVELLQELHKSYGMKKQPEDEAILDIADWVTKAHRQAAVELAQQEIKAIRTRIIDHYRE
jgi:hypothetical protein